MTTAELKAFNAAKATYSMTNDISDTYHDTKNPAEKLAIYTKWLDAYRQNQATIIPDEDLLTDEEMTGLGFFERW